MTALSRFSIRQAYASDLPVLAALERRKFGAAEMDCYDEPYVYTWFETHPEGLLVAESDGRIVGFNYVQRIDWEFGRFDRLHTHDEVTDRGFTRTTHVPDGNSFYGISS